MLTYLIDIAFILVMAATAWMVARQTLLESVVAWLAVLLSALIALCCFEPIADFIIRQMFAPSDLRFTCFLWFFTLVFLFVWLLVMLSIGFLKAMHGATFNFGKADQAGRWFFGLLTGYTLAAFMLTSLHTLPAPREFWGALQPELPLRSNPLMRVGPDYQMLTVAEYALSPRSAWSGTPWTIRGPLPEARLEGNRWSSFPVRYALWREAIELYREEYAPRSGEELKAGTNPNSNFALIRDRRNLR
ncbi:MAG: CvpA family protein [bacterium]|nr:CvpA family protein [bacterium]